MKRLAYAFLAVLLATPPTVAQTLTGITPVVSAGEVNNLVAKAAPGSAFSVYAANATSTAGFLVGFNAVAAPSTGALTPALVIDCVALPAGGSAIINDQPGPGTNYTIGVVYLLTSGANCYTYTTGTITGFIRAKVW